MLHQFLLRRKLQAARAYLVIAVLARSVITRLNATPTSLDAVGAETGARQHEHRYLESLHLRKRTGIHRLAKMQTIRVRRVRRLADDVRTHGMLETTPHARHHRGALQQLKRCQLERTGVARTHINHNISHTTVSLAEIRRRYVLRSQQRLRH